MTTLPMTADGMAALHRLCFFTPPPWRAAAFAGLLDSPHVFAVTQAAAFALGRSAADEAELLTLAVAPEARRQGAATALVAAFEAEALRRSATTAFLEVAADNIAAQALYRMCGYAQAGLRPRYYRAPDGGAVDALILRKALNAR